ncbi:hypothetical protein PMAYCL1PPCAC_05833 [Pristionchus mayeri]|uniref:Uncharacterized protein n=1 Tax=Pristionchus mayeri TaxID=1317129 RepID=A0AAN4ZBS9_9BILA|nr:hypothetical protein PMAYCL1PPCAC_05833 [Pristionchus mayeri]
MTTLQRLETARDVAFLACQSYASQAELDPDEAVMRNLGKQVVHVIECILSHRAINFAELDRLCSGSATKTQAERLSFAVSALLMHLLSEWNDPQDYIPLTKLITRPDGTTFKEEVTDEPMLENPTTATDGVKTECIEDNQEGNALIEHREHQRNGSYARTRRRAPVDAGCSGETTAQPFILDAFEPEEVEIKQEEEEIIFDPTPAALEEVVKQEEDDYGGAFTAKVEGWSGSYDVTGESVLPAMESIDMDEPSTSSAKSKATKSRLRNRLFGKAATSAATTAAAAKRARLATAAAQKQPSAAASATSGAAPNANYDKYVTMEEPDGEDPSPTAPLLAVRGRRKLVGCASLAAATTAAAVRRAQAREAAAKAVREDAVVVQPRPVNAPNPATKRVKTASTSKAVAAPTNAADWDIRQWKGVSNSTRPESGPSSSYKVALTRIRAPTTKPASLSTRDNRIRANKINAAESEAALNRLIERNRMVLAGGWSEEATFRERSCAQCMLRISTLDEWKEHMNQECRMCCISVPSCIAMDAHWEICPKKPNKIFVNGATPRAEIIRTRVNLKRHLSTVESAQQQRQQQLFDRVLNDN